MDDLHVVTLVPWRASDLEREAAWDFTYEHLQSFHWPIYSADSRGPWNRAEAINRAAQDADETPWDIAVIADADTIHLPEDLRRGVALAAKLRTIVVPWRTRWKLSADGSKRFMDRGPVKGPHGYTSEDRDTTDRTRTRMPPKVRGGTVVVPRHMWDLVGGFDEGFVGWGHEDVAFRMAASTLGSGMNELFGTIWHLHHERNLDHDNRGSNDERIGRYQKADGRPSLMRNLLSELEGVAS